MCVVTLVESVRPTDDQVGQMWDQNPKGGGGVAHRIEEDGIKKVRWQKGLSREQMIALNKTLPFPYILHFRQPSPDTSDSLLVTHPFVVDNQATSELEGTSSDWLLFHNGHWNDWRKKVEALMLASGGKIKGPSGPWSDTRALAFVASYLGFVFLEMVNEKILCLGPEKGDIEMFGGPWLQVKAPGSDKTFVVSNRSWETQRTITDTSKLLDAASKTLTPQTGKSGGTSQQTSFPCRHVSAPDHARTGRTEQEQVQKAHEGPLPEAEQGRSSSTLTGMMWDSTRKCYKCHKATHAGQIILRQWHCFQCWSEIVQQPEHVQQQSTILWVGTCEYCKVGSSGMRTTVGDAWICRTCWESNGQPSTYYARERAKIA